MAADVKFLKLKAIDLYDKFLRRLEIGHIDNYDSIMYIISYIESQQDSELIYEFLLNSDVRKRL